jgi:putative membrane protein
MNKDKTALLVIYAVSALVFIVVALLSQLPKAETMPAWATYLPGFNATLNSIGTVLLIGSWLAIKRGRTGLHKKLNLTTFGLSSVFLVSYVIFHAYGVETRYPSDHPWRPVYLTILLTHIVLAAVVLPLVLFSFYWALVGRFDRHRKLVKYSFPIWLYVTTTGVIVYLMISPGCATDF